MGFLGKRRKTTNVNVRNNINSRIVKEEPDPSLKKMVVKKNGFKCNTCNTQYSKFASALQCAQYHRGQK
jgi:hypothetical protein